MRKAANALALFCLMLVFGLIGCQKTENNDPVIKPTNGEVGEKIKLTFACQTMYGGSLDGANQNLYPMVLAVQKFEAEHPNIDVEIVRAPQVPNADETGTVEQGWEEFLATLASTGDFPDVFMAPNMPNVLLQGWCYDMTELTKNDEDFDLLYEDFANSGKFFDRQFAIPFTYEFFGYFVNKTLFDENNYDCYLKNRK